MMMVLVYAIILLTPRQDLSIDVKHRGIIPLPQLVVIRFHSYGPPGLTAKSGLGFNPRKLLSLVIGNRFPIGFVSRETSAEFNSRGTPKGRGWNKIVKQSQKTNLTSFTTSDAYDTRWYFIIYILTTS